MCLSSHPFFEDGSLERELGKEVERSGWKLSSQSSDAAASGKDDEASEGAEEDFN